MKNCGIVSLFLVAAMLSLPTQQAIAGNRLIDAQLPDAPLSVPAISAEKPVHHPADSQPAAAAVNRPAPRLAKYIDVDQKAARLSAKEKLELAGWEQLQPYSFGTQILAAGWEHLMDSDPKYGTDRGGFGERLGAAAIRQNSQAILSDGVFAAVFRQDPRYYRRGSGSYMGRAVYSATRVLAIRNDAGDEATNYSQLVGYAGASVLTMAYYPDVSATWPKTVQGYGVSLVGAAMGNEVHEFGPDVIHLVFHRHDK